ncbi:MAG: rRNA maturation RNase YbeY [Bacillota bacterium]|jgi:probable rRNA maturation factor
MPVSISNQQAKISFNPELESIITRVIEEVYRREGIHGAYQVAVLLADDEKIRQLNRDYRGIDQATDVLSFAYLENMSEEAKSRDPGGEEVLGDIVISLERAARQADEYGHSLAREVGFLIAHGMLHLVGYDHKLPEEEKIMRRKEEEILQCLGLKR